MCQPNPWVSGSSGLVISIDEGMCRAGTNVSDHIGRPRSDPHDPDPSCKCAWLMLVFKLPGLRVGVAAARINKGSQPKQALDMSVLIVSWWMKTRVVVDLVRLCHL